MIFKKVRGHGLHIVPPQSTKLIFYSHAALVQPTELERAEVDVPDAVVDLLEPDILPDADE